MSGSLFAPMFGRPEVDAAGAIAACCVADRLADLADTHRRGIPQVARVPQPHRADVVERVRQPCCAADASAQRPGAHR
ncbi:hypothetical protein ACNTMW_00540 [Planosporangium sp. 12N6]|uniref:hypothetical protein n=1 Tax=Planosporangium spinosum TaxID=3402278 RepID=UPI003CF50438